MVSINLRVGKSFTLGERHAKAKSDPKQITISLNARNLINQSTSLINGQGLSGNRRIELQLKFNF